MGYMYKSAKWVFLNVELCQLYAHAEHMHVVFLAYYLHEDMYIHMTVCIYREGKGKNAACNSINYTIVCTIVWNCIQVRPCST